MRNWELNIEIDPAREQPLFMQLASTIAEAIGRGRLKPGEPLPSSREMAELLGINRNTVIAGYAELAAEGLVVTHARGGTYVAPSLPVLPIHAPPIREPLPAYTLAPLSLQNRPAITPHRDELLLSHHSPDVRLLPACALTRAFRRAIGQRGRSVLTHTDPLGHVRLRSALATMLTRTRGLPTVSDDILITRSIERGLDIIARTLISPGDAVVVEAFGCQPTRHLLQLAGGRLLPVRVDENGLDIDALESLLAKERIRAVVTIPHHQFPTTVVMSAARRARLAELAEQHHFAIIEDDYDFEFHYEGKPVLPIAAGPGRSNVIYIASMGNLLAPSLCPAFVVAPRPVLQRLIALRTVCDAQGDAALECAIAELYEDGELLRHVRRMRCLYAARRDALAIALVKHLGSAVDFRVPEGGLGLWIRVDDDIDTAAWSAAGEREGVQFNNAREFEFSHRDTTHMRLSFSYHDPTELNEAVQRMARALARTHSSNLTLGAADTGNTLNLLERRRIRAAS